MPNAPTKHTIALVALPLSLLVACSAGNEPATTATAAATIAARPALIKTDVVVLNWKPRSCGSAGDLANSIRPWIDMQVVDRDGNPVPGQKVFVGTAGDLLDATEPAIDRDAQHRPYVMSNANGIIHIGFAMPRDYPVKPGWHFGAHTFNFDAEMGTGGAAPVHAEQVIYLCETCWDCQ
ncbi:MAG: hypothetical protein IPG74_01460 [Flavobacteriales bacterium]|nr:hypothetical protein [Flavobacteriales bacterium]MBK7553437.1 hypothetical protein [Flavobacteriales bacterium]